MVFRKILLVRIWSLQWSDLIHGGCFFCCFFCFFFFNQIMTLIQKGISRVQEGLVLLHDTVSTVACEWLEGLNDLTHVGGSWCRPQTGTPAGAFNQTAQFSTYFLSCVFLVFLTVCWLDFKKAVYSEYKP